MPPEVVDASSFSPDIQEFWRREIPELADPSEIESCGVIFQFGVPPNRIDLLNDIDGIDFEAAWRGRTRVVMEGGSEGVPLSYIGLARLIENKKASGRPKDLDDLPFLLEALKQGGRP